jgi:hypothetical protein
VTEAQKTQLRKFLDRWLEGSPMGSRWVNYGAIQVYLRKTPVHHLGQTHTAITIANVSVNRDHHGKGWFRETIEWALEQDVDLVKVENAITPRMQILLHKNGWISDYENPPSFHLPARKGKSAPWPINEQGIVPGSVKE